VLNLADVIEAITGKRPQGVDLLITDAFIDSRQSIPGSIFFAIPGERVDGHNYVGDAFHKGSNIAVIQKDLSGLFPVLKLDQGTIISKSDLPDIPFCILVDNTILALQTIAKFWRTKMKLQVTGITGSVGKSTTKELVAEVLNQKFRTLKNAGNLNNEIGLPLTILRMTEGHEQAVLEMGFYIPGEITLLCDIARPIVGVVTNIGTVHAERAGSQATIAQGKAELIQSLPVEGTAILNYDDPLVKAMEKDAKCRVISYGINPEADIWADHIIGEGLEGIRFHLHYKDEIFQIRVPLIGQHSVHTALRAAAVGLAQGLTWGEIIVGLRTSRAQLRLVAVHTVSGALVLDDTYNASPESTLAALNLLEELEGRKIAVLGDMLELGPYTAEGHEKVGFRASEIVEELVVVGELGKLIGDAAHEAGLSMRHIHYFLNTEETTEFLQTILAEGDVVLVKGSHGMRMDRIVSALESEE